MKARNPLEERPPERCLSNDASSRELCEAHAVGHDVRELGANEHQRMRSHPNDCDHDGRPVIALLAHCIAHRNRPVILGVQAHLGRNGDLKDDDEVDQEAKLLVPGRVARSLLHLGLGLVMGARQNNKWI